MVLDNGFELGWQGLWSKYCVYTTSQLPVLRAGFSGKNTYYLVKFNYGPPFSFTPLRRVCSAVGWAAYGYFECGPVVVESE